MKTSQLIGGFGIALPVLAVILVGCPDPGAPTEEYEDGTYRGIFADEDSIQVNVEFTLEDGVVTEASFRHLRRDDDYHLETEEEPYASVVQQYHDALDHLEGNDLQAHLTDLYEPEDVVTTEVDGYTAATVRSNKIISAVRDGLNRGVYSY